MGYEDHLPDYLKEPFRKAMNDPGLVSLKPQIRMLEELREKYVAEGKDTKLVDKMLEDIRAKQSKLK